MQLHPTTQLKTNQTVNLTPRFRVLGDDQIEQIFFAALDVLTKERLQQDFLDIWQTTPMTVIFVTHDLEEALFLSQRVVVMSRNPGRVEKVVDVPLSHPRSLVVKTTQEFQAIRRDLIQVMVSMHGGLEARE